jgi:urea transport system substrate-binding protein
MSFFNRRKFLKTSAAVAATSTLPMSLYGTIASAASTVKMGILHSLTGTIAIAEKSVVDAELLAVEEINNAGGVMGLHLPRKRENCSRKTRLHR